MIKHKQTINLGDMSGIDDTELMLPDQLPGNETAVESLGGDGSDAMWWFVNKGLINGVPVAECDRCAKVDSEALLQQAFILQRIPRSRMFRMSPDNAEDLEAYEALLRDIYEGRALLVDETKQFDAEKGCFLTWVRYDEISYVIHPRYTYLKD